MQESNRVKSHVRRGTRDVMLIHGQSGLSFWSEAGMLFFYIVLNVIFLLYEHSQCFLYFRNPHRITEDNKTILWCDSLLQMAPAEELTRNQNGNAG